MPHDATDPPLAMTLGELVSRAGVDTVVAADTRNIMVTGIGYDSRDIRTGMLFVAMKG